MQFTYLLRRRTKTAVSIMDKHIATQGDCGVVIDAARSVCDITHDDGQRISEPIRGIEQETR